MRGKTRQAREKEREVTDKAFLGCVGPTSHHCVFKKPQVIKYITDA